jgi:hypothetical protein
LAPTPHYVLMDGDKPVSMLLAPQSSTEPSSESARAIFGFSDKPQYDTFRSNSQLAYKPYPLVKGFLRGQIELRSQGIAFIAIDAAGPLDPSFQACSPQQVLDAMESNSKTLAALSLSRAEG